MANDEFKDLNQEFSSVNENQIIRENPSASEAVVAKENIEAQEFVDPTNQNEEAVKTSKINKDKKNRALSLLTGGLTATIAAVLVGMTTMINVKMKAEFEDVSYKDSQISYKVNVSDMTEDETLTTYIYEENVLIQTVNLVDEDEDGVIEGILPVDGAHVAELLENDNDKSISYRFDLKGVVGLNVERSFDSWIVRIDEVTSKFEDVNYWCECGKNGHYWFQMNFVDDYGIFSDFEAYIEDKSGNRVYCEFSDDLHAPQKIYVLDLVGAKGTLTINYKADGVSVDPIVQEVNF